MTFNEELQNFVREYECNYNSPNALLSLRKTFQSHNISIPDWNILILHLAGVTQREDALKTIIIHLKAYLDDAVTTLTTEINKKAEVSGTTKGNNWETLTIDGETHDLQPPYAGGVGIDVDDEHNIISIDENVVATREFVNEKISTVYKPQGSITVEALNALTDSVTADMDGFIYNTVNSGILTKGNIQVNTGDNIAIIWNILENTWAWDNLAGMVDLSGKADKVAGATADNLSALDESGNLTDSGLAVEDVALVEDIPPVTTVDFNVTLVHLLGEWDSSTGTTSAELDTNPYAYAKGDYFIVSKIGTRCPNGGYYTVGETNYAQAGFTITPGDIWYFDGISWQMQTGLKNAGVNDVRVNNISVVASGIAKLTKENLGTQRYQHNITLSGMPTCHSNVICLDFTNGTHTQAFNGFTRLRSFSIITYDKTSFNNKTLFQVYNLIRNKPYEMSLMASISDIPGLGSFILKPLTLNNNYDTGGTPNPFQYVYSVMLDDTGQYLVRVSFETGDHENITVTDDQVSIIS